MKPEAQTVPTVVEDLPTDNSDFLAIERKDGEQPAVLSAVFRSIFVEGPKDFFGGIFSFFRRYFRHYKEVFRFFRRPSLKVAPFDKRDIRESSQQSFEIALLFTAALIFMIKQNWVPVNKELQEQYGNDIMQLFLELAIFIIFASAYFAQILLSVLCGRLLRILFKVPITRNESDVLFCYLNNSFFSIAALLAFVLRCSTQYQQIENTPTETGLMVFCVLLAFCFVVWWSFNFARLNRLPVVQRILFHLFSIALFTLLYGTGVTAVCLFVIGA